VTCRRGFSIAEMTVVLAVMGIVAALVLPQLQRVLIAAKAAATNSNMQTIMKSVGTFVQANSCLPCPSVPYINSGRFGELGSDKCAVCSNPQGVVPFVALGLPAKIAKDGFGHWITMRIDPELANPNPPVVPPYALCSPDEAENETHVCFEKSGKAAKGICKEANGVFTGIWVHNTETVTDQKAAVLLISYGERGYGSYNVGASGVIPRPETHTNCNNLSGGATVGFADCNNSVHNTAHFYDAVRGSDETFNHTLLYLDRNAIVSMFSSGACNTEW